jgi:uncharacterized protein
LGAGESEALALAKEVDVDLLLLDDRAARQLAERLGIPLSGTLGVLLEAKSVGSISTVRPLLDGLLSLPFHMTSRLYETVLRKAGEPQ